MSHLDGWPVLFRLPVQWGDQDAFGHVNNVMFFKWWESSRIRYSERIGLVRDEEGYSLGTVLVSIQCDFRHQLTYPDEIEIGARIDRVGNSSFNLSHRLVSIKQDRVAAEAVSTMVFFDFKTQQSVRIPDDIRTRIHELESGRQIPGTE